MPEDEAREIYEEMLPQFESHMLEIGWTYKEFREYEPTPEEKDLTYQLRETTSFDAVAFFNATGDKN